MRSLLLSFLATLLPSVAIAQTSLATRLPHEPRSTGENIENTGVIDTTTRFRFDIPERPIRDALATRMGPGLARAR